MDKAIEWLLYGILAFVFASILILLVFEATAERFSLKKSDWKCTASHEESQTSVAIIGSGIYPNTVTKTVCDQWSRNK